MPNRLGDSVSPYLRQHADNPVHWWQWGGEAFDEAAARGVPVLLSVGYAACHWCHVMARESFEYDAVAALMNEWFVNVKVDREERPDVDAAYQAATQALTGQGGWPMTVFLTPQAKPFYAGTYFPPRPAMGRPSFTQIITAVHDTWSARHDEVLGSADQISAALAERGRVAGGSPPSAEDCAEAVRVLARSEDRRHGGFGPAPKFPTFMVIEWLLRHAARDRGDTGQLAMGMVERTCRVMAFSAVYDQLDGGFARYGVDSRWVVPHFEKMLYDNALAARAYLHWWRATGDPTGSRIASETCDVIVNRLSTMQGGFASALDADTDGVEGLSYVWNPVQLQQALDGRADADWAAALLGVDAAGTFEHGTSTLQLTRDVWGEPDQSQRWTAIRARLLAARRARPQPARDEKVVLAWNALAISALAETGALLGRPDLVRAATGCAELLVGTHRVGSRWRRISRDGRCGTAPAVLEDLGDLAGALFTLSAVTGDNSWGATALTIVELILEQFSGPDGTLCDNSRLDMDRRLAGLTQPADPGDNAYPSGTSAAADALLTAASWTGRADLRRAAERSLAPAAEFAVTTPRFAGAALAAAEALLDGPREIVVIGRATDSRTDDLHRVALAATAPGAVVVRAEPATWPPLITGRGLIAGGAAGYVCRGGVCRLPVTETGALAAEVDARC
jgi:uncharacterized protein YyaL (SSP411 family)